MLLLSISLFALAVLLGLRLADRLFKRKQMPRAMVVSHGVIALVAVVVLFLHAAKSPHTLLTVAMGLFLLAAGGGVILFANDLHHRPGPRFLVAGHAIVAVAALGLVLIVAFA